MAGIPVESKDPTGNQTQRASRASSPSAPSSGGEEKIPKEKGSSETAVPTCLRALPFHYESPTHFVLRKQTIVCSCKLFGTWTVLKLVLQPRGRRHNGVGLGEPELGLLKNQHNCWKMGHVEASWLAKEAVERPARVDLQAFKRGSVEQGPRLLSDGSPKSRHFAPTGVAVDQTPCGSHAACLGNRLAMGFSSHPQPLWEKAGCLGSPNRRAGFSQAPQVLNQALQTPFIGR